MATRYYGASFGATMKTEVTEAAATTSKDVEVSVIYTNANNSKVATLNALDAIRQAIIEDTFPPA